MILKKNQFHSLSMSPCGRMKDLHRFIRQCHSAKADN